MAYTQENRFISIATPLGKEALLLAGFSGLEGISRLFVFHLDLLSENPSLPFEDIVGQNVTITVVLPDNSVRYFNGIINRFSQGHSDARFTYYQAEMVPWLWFLTQTTDCRIFQNMTVPDIIKNIFKDLGFSDFKNVLEGSFEPREYCVQYRETDFNFVSRLMEQYGIYYFFEHEKDKHTLILANTPTAHKPCPGQEKARYEYAAGGLREEDTITAWRMEQNVRPGKYALMDYNFETPSADLAVNMPTTVSKSSDGKYEIYDYHPGEYGKRAQGDTLAKIRMEEEETSHIVVTAASTCRAFTSGYRFELSEPYRKDMDTSYLLIAVQHTAIQGGYASGQGSEFSYTNSFTCIPYSVPFRPPWVTSKPVVQGPQTAIVVGKKGEEIWVDKYGRVKVQFHWDREGQYNENSSCWVRVSQTWAGKRWGAMFIPRIGQEVIVDFLEGDPDQPIITGRVYNAEEMPPYELPAEQTKSTLKSLSSKGGGGFNELRFEDKKGQEQLFIHAEKNQDNRVKNDSMEWVGRSRHLIVNGDQLELVGGDKHLKIKGDQNEKVEGTVSLEAVMDMQKKVGMNYALDAGIEIHLKAGMNLVIESGTNLTLKVGGNFININPAGVFITGTLVMINSGGAAGSGSGASPEPPKAPAEADKAKPGQMSKLPPPKQPPAPGSYSPAALVMKEAARNGTPFCEAG